MTAQNIPRGPVIRRMTQNAKGKDYIVGDIHGNRTLLNEMLDTAQFDFNTDRLFSVGDIVDRGTENLEALELLTQPWFFHTLGNHDLNLIFLVLHHKKEFATLANVPGLSFRHEISTNSSDIYDAFPWDPALFSYQNGGEWLIELLQSNENHSLLLHLTHKMLSSPHIHCIGKDSKRFHVVHAGLHPYFMITPENAVTNNDIDTNIWAKSNPSLGVIQLVTQRYLDWKGTHENYALSKTYCGHTPHKQIYTFAQHLNLDTGVNSQAGMLTLTCHQTGQAWQQSK